MEVSVKPTKGIVVDGACSGNPGPGEYRGVDLETGVELFRVKLNPVTNNLMEFFALVHAIKHIKEHKKHNTVYTDSQTAIAWAERKSVSTSLADNESTKAIHTFIKRCISFLVMDCGKSQLPIQKWKTKEWGEIPADFGNKQNSKKIEVPDEFISKNKLRQWCEQEEAKKFSGEQSILLNNLKITFKL